MESLLTPTVRPQLPGCGRTLRCDVHVRRAGAPGSAGILRGSYRRFWENSSYRSHPSHLARYGRTWRCDRKHGRESMEPQARARGRTRRYGRTSPGATGCDGVRRVRPGMSHAACQEWSIDHRPLRRRLAEGRVLRPPIPERGVGRRTRLDLPSAESPAGGTLFEGLANPPLPLRGRPVSETGVSGLSLPRVGTSWSALQGVERAPCACACAGSAPDRAQRSVRMRMERAPLLERSGAHAHGAGERSRSALPSEERAPNLERAPEILRKWSALLRKRRSALLWLERAPGAVHRERSRSAPGAAHLARCGKSGTVTHRSLESHSVSRASHPMEPESKSPTYSNPHHSDPETPGRRCQRVKIPPVQPN